MKDIRQTPEYADYLSRIGWKIEKKDGVFCFIKKFPLLGSFIKIQRPEKLSLQKLKELAKKYRAFQIIIESELPLHTNQLLRHGFKKGQSPYLPTKTLQLDLTLTKEKLWQQLKKDAKYALNKTRGLKAKENKNPGVFRNYWQRAVGWKRYLPPLSHLQALKRSFGKKALFLSTENGSAGAIFLIGDKMAYYWQAFTNHEGRKNLYQYRIVWEGILWAKRKGAKLFDFEGVYDERFPNKSWLGFTHFKKSFGGSEIEYPGCFVKTKFWI